MTQRRDTVEIVIHLRDLGNALVEAWKREFAGVVSVHVSCGDIFSTKARPVEVEMLR